MVSVDISKVLDVTPEHRRREVSSFKKTFDITSFLDYFEINGHMKELESIPLPEGRFSLILKVFEQFYPQPNKETLDFCIYVLNQFQRKHPEPKYSVGMCEWLKIELGDEGYVKTCLSPKAKNSSINCVGFKQNDCPDYIKLL